ncbi:hypothetical protein [Candidatus Pantoea persica]|uniref:hypothetical protein n=1 Tax=Candidatus Pantoea persica TaxID=2518128 RepID=UPI00215D8565|nr:hypothetical protein [Candidatus Pantoea persica]MBA2814624.1 flagellar hook-length control protein FliK [Candidatus Pantoea persica]
MGQLNALLATFENPGSLDARLTTENIKADSKSADDKEQESTETLNSSDAQTMQALFAMLPITSTAAALTSTAAESLPAAGGETRRSMLAALSQILNNTPGQA